ncbi:MAG: TerC family protein [Bacteriovoracales bacterium]
MEHSFYAWIGFHIFVFLMLALDLFVFHKEAHEIKVKEALSWSAVWIGLALIFNLGILFYMGKVPALEFFTGYLIEKSLSIDNLFVFLTVFTAFGVPPRFQHTILFWGIIGALVMRAVFIFSGIALINKFGWIMYIFGGFLLITGIKMAFAEDKEKNPKDHWLVKWSKKNLPFTDAFHEKKFWIKENGKILGTPLLLVLLIVEATDLIFAVDSIPAILAITRDSFIVYTSNIFAILGLRSLYFALAGMMSLFTYLRYGLAAILVFVGIKLCLLNIYHVPIGMSLGVIASILAFSIYFSIWKARQERKLPKILS